MPGEDKTPTDLELAGEGRAGFRITCFGENDDRVVGPFGGQPQYLSRNELDLDPIPVALEILNGGPRVFRNCFNRMDLIFTAGSSPF